MGGPHNTVFHMGLRQERAVPPWERPTRKREKWGGSDGTTESRELEERHGDLRSSARELMGNWRWPMHKRMDPKLTRDLSMIVGQHSTHPLVFTF